MAADATVLLRTERHFERASRRAPLGFGITMIYLSVVVLIPLAAVVAQATGAWQEAGWRTITNPQVLAAIGLTVGASLLITLVNVLVGIAAAWVLVRDRFAGRTMLDAVVDLPLALPTIVAGLTLLALYGPTSPLGLNLAYTRAAIVLALLFVSFPFVVRSVQPALLALDEEVEAAARTMGAGGWTLLRHIILPQLLPAILSGAALAFARAIGEYGSVVLLSGNIPFSTQVVSVYIFGEVEQGSNGTAAIISLVLLVLTLAVLIGVDVVRRRVGSYAD